MYSFEKRSKEECLEAVKQDGYALQYVKEQDKNVRRHNFEPVESNLTEEQVKLEASRCLHCKNPKIQHS